MEKNSKRNKTEPLVCILTPVYNGEKYLEDCIKSVINQSYENWEYVIVNNCSTDRSLEISEKYARIDDRIKISNNTEFLPVMENLNHTFRKISEDSKYCKVIHADDWMFPECISKMVAHAEKFPNAGIINSYYLDDDTVRPQGLTYPSHIIDGRKLGREYFLNHHTYFGAPSNLLIRTELLINRDRVYDPDNIHSDHGLCLDILKEHDFGFVHQVLTFSRRHEQSHTNRVAEELNTYGLGRLKNLKNYGNFYLSEEELKEKKDKILKSIKKMIARKKLFRRSVDYHSKELKDIGIKLSTWDLAKYMGIEILSFWKYLSKLKRRII